MKTIYSVALATAATVMVGAFGPASRSMAADNAASPPGDKATTARPSVSENDARIESSFKKTHVYMAYLKDEKIAVSSNDGTVTLTGSVADVNHKPMAEHIAAALPGVKSVNNRIEIIGEPIPEKSDAWISSRVMATLTFHRNVSARNTVIETKDGVVTLKGEASSSAQKELTAEYAEDVEGVKDVKNEMTVAAAPEKPGQTVAEKIDDASITAQVKMTLLFHRSTSALKTKVDTNDGVVTLSGEAKNGAERDLVAKLVNDINGVNRVVNNMTIDTAASKRD